MKFIAFSHAKWYKSNSVEKEQKVASLADGDQSPYSLHKKPVLYH